MNILRGGLVGRPAKEIRGRDGRRLRFERQYRD
jgi:hypothetical protein